MSWSLLHRLNCINININIRNSCPTQGRVEGWDAMKPHIIGRRVARVPADHAWRTITSADEMKRNGWDECGMKSVIGENRRNPEKNLPRPRFVHHETHMEWPRRELGTPAVGGESLTACATRPRFTNNSVWKFQITSKLSPIVPWQILLFSYLTKEMSTYLWSESGSIRKTDDYVLDDKLWSYDTLDNRGVNFLTFVLQLRKNSGKNLNEEIYLTEDRTRAHWKSC